MPLELHWNTPSGAQIGLWRIVEDVERLRAAVHPARIDTSPLAHITAPNRRRQWWAGRATLQGLLALDAGVEIGVENNGKPVLRPGGPQISLSHSYAWAAAIAHPNRPVAVDLELLTAPRNLAIHRLFMTPAEQEFFFQGQENNTDLERFLLIWSAKECLYKLHAAELPELSFKRHLWVEPPTEYPPNSPNLLRAGVTRPGVHLVHQLRFRRLEDLIVTWIITA